jgi:AcrR family transcriptional regulator
MPTPARTSRDEIVAAGREILALDGIEALTMQRVADRVGVKAPSLYRRVASRSALVQLVAADVVADVISRLEAAASTGDPQRDLRALAVALRDFALADPHSYGLLFSPLPENSAPDPATFAAAAAPVIRVAGELAGADQALSAARTVTAWASGFLRMELAGGFQLGGSVNEAFEFGIELLGKGLVSTRRPVVTFGVSARPS